MAVHDTACVPVREEGRVGADPYPTPAAAGTEPGDGHSCPGILLLARLGKGRERVRALLEIQLRPEDPGASPPDLPRTPRRIGSPPAGETALGAKVLPFPLPASS